MRTSPEAKSILVCLFHSLSLRVFTLPGYSDLYAGQRMVTRSIAVPGKARKVSVGLPTEGSVP